jgi:hypothetical protein
MLNIFGIFINKILSFGNLKISDIPKKAYEELMTAFESLKTDQIIFIPSLIKLCIKIGGKLIIDDTGNKKYGLKYWARKQKDLKTGGYFWGYKIVLFLWDTGKQRFPIGFALWHKDSDSLNELAYAGISKLRNEYKLKPEVVLADGGYSTDRLEKLLTDYGWAFIFRWKNSRKLKTNGINKRTSIKKLIPRGYGSTIGFLANHTKVKVFRRQDRFYISNRMQWDMQKIVETYKVRWKIEEVFRVLKTCIGIDRCHQHSMKAQEMFLWICMLAFSCLELLSTDYSGLSVYKVLQNVNSQEFSINYPLITKVFKLC